MVLFLSVPRKLEQSDSRGVSRQSFVLSLTRSKAVLAAKCVELAFYTAQFDRLLSAWDSPPDLGAHQRTVLCACARTHTNLPSNPGVHRSDPKFGMCADRRSDYAFRRDFPRAAQDSDGRRVTSSVRSATIGRVLYVDQRPGWECVCDHSGADYGQRGLSGPVSPGGSCHWPRDDRVGPTPSKDRPC